MAIEHPHEQTPLRTGGERLAEASAAAILLHGRGAGAGDILGLAGHLDPSFAYLAPEAAGRTWYPQRFLAPRQANQPYLDSALRRVRELVDEIVGAGIPAERVLLAGFSQGACLAAEAGARMGLRLGAVVAFTGGLIGPEPRSEDYEPGLAGTPVLLASGDPDPHVPWERVEASARILRQLGAEVEVMRFPGLGHTIAPDALAAMRRLQDRIVSGGPPGRAA